MIMMMISKSKLFMMDVWKASNLFAKISDSSHFLVDDEVIYDCPCHL